MASTSAVQTQLGDIFSLPRMSSGIFKVWMRNFYYFKYKWLATAFWAIFEPVLYLFAIGMGLGRFVGQIEGVPYIEWFFPGLLASTAMLVSFFETTYGSFTKLTHQKTYAALLVTPISSHDIVLGEILWAMTKGLIGAVGVAIVGFAVGGVSLSGFIPSFFILVLLSWVFASLGMLVTSFATHYDSFIYAQSGFIMPMYLFSGTYFPASQLPKGLQIVAWCLPLTHGVSAVRMLLLGDVTPMLAVNAGVLLLMGLAISNWATARIHRKIIY
jgi:lipooligosaccharide transport system permease protein